MEQKIWMNQEKAVCRFRNELLTVHQASIACEFLDIDWQSIRRELAAILDDIPCALSASPWQTAMTHR